MRARRRRARWRRRRCWRPGRCPGRCPRVPPGSSCGSRARRHGRCDTVAAGHRVGDPGGLEDLPGVESGAVARAGSAIEDRHERLTTVVPDVAAVLGHVERPGGQHRGSQRTDVPDAVEGEAATDGCGLAVGYGLRPGREVLHACDSTSTGESVDDLHRLGVVLAVHLRIEVAPAACAASVAAGSASPSPLPAHDRSPARSCWVPTATTPAARSSPQGSDPVGAP